MKNIKSDFHTGLTSKVGLRYDIRNTEVILFKSLKRYVIYLLLGLHYLLFNHVFVKLVEPIAMVQTAIPIQNKTQTRCYQYVG